jgi:hypothetical protein
MTLPTKEAAGDDQGSISADDPKVLPVAERTGRPFGRQRESEFQSKRCKTFH